MLPHVNVTKLKSVPAGSVQATNSAAATSTDMGKLAYNMKIINGKVLNSLENKSDYGRAAPAAPAAACVWPMLDFTEPMPHQPRSAIPSPSRS